MELIDYIDNYIWLVDEVITVYGSYKVINYGMQNLSYIQDLQDKIQRGHVINIEREQERERNGYYKRKSVDFKAVKGVHPHCNALSEQIENGFELIESGKNILSDIHIVGLECH